MRARPGLPAARLRLPRAGAAPLPRAPALGTNACVPPGLSKQHLVIVILLITGASRICCLHFERAAACGAALLTWRSGTAGSGACPQAVAPCRRRYWVCADSSRLLLLSTHPQQGVEHSLKCPNPPGIRTTSCDASRNDDVALGSCAILGFLGQLCAAACNFLAEKCAMARLRPWLAALACLLLGLLPATVVDATLDKTVCCE